MMRGQMPRQIAEAPASEMTRSKRRARITQAPATPKEDHAMYGQKGMKSGGKVEADKLSPRKAMAMGAKKDDGKKAGKKK